MTCLRTIYLPHSVQVTMDLLGIKLSLVTVSLVKVPTEMIEWVVCVTDKFQIRHILVEMQQMKFCFVTAKLSYRVLPISVLGGIIEHGAIYKWRHL